MLKQFLHCSYYFSQDPMEMEFQKRKLGMLVARKFSKTLSMMESLDFQEDLTGKMLQ